MKAEQNTITSSRWKERQKIGTERRKPLCEKPVDKTKTYENKEKIQICQPQTFSLRKFYRNKLTRSKPLNARLPNTRVSTHLVNRKKPTTFKKKY